MDQETLETHEKPAQSTGQEEAPAPPMDTQMKPYEEQEPGTKGDLDDTRAGDAGQEDSALLGAGPQPLPGDLVQLPGPLLLAAPPVETPELQSWAAPVPLCHAAAGQEDAMNCDSDTTDISHEVLWALIS